MECHRPRRRKETALPNKRPSLRGRLATLLVRAVVKHWPPDDKAMVKRARKVFGEPKLVRFRPPRDIRIEEVKDPVRGEWLTPAHPAFPDVVLLYFHGGGYISCSPQTHRPVTTTLARLIGCRVFSVDYRLAPEHPFPAAVNDTVAAFQWLVKSGVRPENIALAGDSAGGGLVLATLVSLRDQGTALPACAACIAPVVDLTGEFNYTNQKSCAMFFPADGQAFARIYLNGASALSPLASPLFADWKGMPPLLIQVADKEFLFDDAVRLNEKALASGVDSRLHVYAGLPHVWHMFVGTVPEAKEALQEIAGFVKEKLGATRQKPDIATAR
jgi:monoterpene epsilon-lactone hydrolase